MSDCCTSGKGNTQGKKTHRCPVNGLEYSLVSERTIKHHIKQSWQWQGHGKHYYFCEDPDCDVVYFADDDSVIVKSQLRNEVGIKSTSENALLCYCFGVTRADALSNPEVRDFVVAQTKDGLCSCETSNPSGRCCLKNFPPHG